MFGVMQEVSNPLFIQIFHPGEYLFRVKAANNNGVWNETGASLKIIIKSPWWQTWWALFAIFLWV